MGANVSRFVAQSTFSVSANGGQSGSYVFATQDAADKVLSYYADQIKAGGMTASTTSNNTDARSAASSPAQTRTATHGGGNGNSRERRRTVNVTFEEKKSAN